MFLFEDKKLWDMRAMSKRDMASQETHETSTPVAKSNGKPDTMLKARPGDDGVDENKNETNSAKNDNDKITLKRNMSIRSRKCLVLTDLLLVCTGFLLHIAAFNGTVSLQSSINGQLGIQALTAVSISGMLSNLLLPTLVIDKLGIKWTLVATVIFRSTFPLTNFHTAWWTLFPGGAISGLVIGPMWASQSAYISWLGRRYAEMTGESVDSINSRFFGVFFMFQRSAHLTGTFISSLVFRRPASRAVGEGASPLVDIVSKVCASNYCNDNLDEIFNEASNVTIEGTSTFYIPSEHQKNVLFGIYIALCVAAPLLFLFTTSKNKTVSPDASKSGSKLYKKLSATFTHMTHWKAILLIPMSLYSGASFAFFVTGFNLAFVTCVLGIDSLGYVATASAGTGAAFAIACGALVKYTGGRAVMLLATSGMFATQVAMLNWNPSTESSVTLYVMAATWGASNTVIQSQLTAFLASQYRTSKSESSAYASHHLWQMVGMTFWHSTSVHECVDTQIYTITGMLVVGILSLMVVDVVSGRQNKKLAKTEDLQQTDTRL